MKLKRIIPLLAGLFLFALLWTQGPAQAAPADDLIITGVIDGPLPGGIPKAIEFFVVNDISDLSIYGFGSANNGGGTDGQEFTFPAITATAGDFIYVASEDVEFTNFFGFAPDHTGGAANINGDDAIELFTNGLVTDIFGDINTDGSGQPWEYLDGWAYRNDYTGPDGNTFVLGNWSFSGANALDGETTNALATTPFPIGTYSQAIIDVPPTISSTNPTNSTANIAVDSTITINFSEAVDATASAFSLACPSGTPVAFTTNPTLPESSSSFILTPNSDLPNGTTCEVTVTAAEVTDQDIPLDNMASDYTFSFTTENPGGVIYIHDIQGAGSNIAISGTVTVEGVVVGDYQDSTELSGFFLQEEDADIDANVATSEGIFVYCNTCTTAVSEGQIASITGTASDRFNKSEIDITVVGGSVSVTDSGNNMALVTPGDIDLPVPAGFANVDDYYEQFEGMLISFVDEMTVSEYFQLARYGQMVLTEGGKTQQFTHTNLPSVAGYTIHQDEMARRRIILDDFNNTENNTDPVLHPQPGGFSVSNFVRGGYTIPTLQGVLDYSGAGSSGTDAFRVRPQQTSPVAFTNSNPRPAIPTISGEVTVASFNVLNYFNGDGIGGGFPTSRGADSAAELARQEAKIVNAIIALDADIIGLMEIENDGFDSNSAIQDLVTGLNATAGAGTYAFIDAGGLIGGDAIAVGLLYKPAAVTPVATTAVLDAPAFMDPLDSGSDRNRAALAQSFQVNDNSLQSYGGVFTVIVNHLKSKGSSCGVGDDSADTGQANCNGSRTGGADYMVNTWLPTDPTNTTAIFGFHDTDYLIIGDLNAYALEDPITTITSAGYTDLLNAYQGTNAYSFVFSGEWGYLDHALASSSLTSQVQSATHWHINADESSLLDYNDGIWDVPGEADYEQKPSVNTLYANDVYRSSDHDPLIVGLNVTPTADYGDLNSSYGTAWHTGFGELRLGSNWSAEEGSPADDGDDGIQIGPGTGSGGQWQDGAAGGSLIVTINDTINGTATGCFYAWIDWDRNGSFEDPGERVIEEEEGGSGTYSFTVPNGTFSVPPGSSTPLTTYVIRTRLYAACSSGPIGQGFGGEVEDLSVDFTPTAVTLQSFNTTNQNTLWLAVLLVIVTMLSGSLLIWQNGRSQQKQ